CAQFQPCPRQRLVGRAPSSMLFHMPPGSFNSHSGAPADAELAAGEADHGAGVGARRSTRTTPGRKPDQERPPYQPPHGVVLHNDDLNTFDFVMACLRRVFGYTTPKAFLLTMRAHATGQAVIWVGMKEHAEFKAEQLSLCGPDPVMKGRGARPLGVSVVPLED